MITISDQVICIYTSLYVHQVQILLNYWYVIVYLNRWLIKIKQWLGKCAAFWISNIWKRCKNELQRFSKLITCHKELFFVFFFFRIRFVDLYSSYILLFKGHCNVTWDTILCWEETAAGVVARQDCPSYVKNMYKGKFSMRGNSKFVHLYRSKIQSTHK